jgi:hypothetical protein
VEEHYNEWRPRGSVFEPEEEDEEEEEALQETGSSDHGDAESSDEDEYSHLGAQNMDVGRTPDGSKATKRADDVRPGGALLWGSFSSAGQSDMAMSQGCTPMSLTPMSSLKQLPAILDTGHPYAKAR